MTDQAQKNKERLFNAIQNLKDCAFGANTSYMPFCYSYSNGEYSWDDKKLDEFVDALVKYASNCVYYRPDFERALYLFYSLTIKFISASCNSDEQTFVSLRKIAKVTEKEPGIKCTYEYLIEEQRAYIDRHFNSEEYWSNYREFIGLLELTNYDDFLGTINYSLQKFIDEHELSLFADTAVINSMIMRINRTSSQITGEFRRRERLSEVSNDD